MKSQMFPIDYPYVGATCVYSQAGFRFHFGGFGSFFNKASIRHMTSPIFCGREDDEMTRTICATLSENRIGEFDVFRQGDSVFDVFYKYSATRNFCLHSDWALGYMISRYSGGQLHELYPKRCQRHPCDRASITCHNHGPDDMKAFLLTHPLPGR